MKDKYFSMLIIAFLLFIGLYSLIFQDDVSLFEKRNLHTNLELNETSFLDSSFQNSIEDIIADQIPFRNEQMYAYYKTKLAFYTPIMLTQNEMSLLRITEDSSIVGKSDYMVYNLVEYDYVKYDYAASRAYNISILSEQNPSAKFYIYKPIRPEETTWFNTEFITSYAYQFEENFLQNLNPNISYHENLVTSWEEYQKLYYKADHHWNIDGAYNGYIEIVDILNADFNIGEPRDVIEKKCFDEEFYGSFSYKVARVSKPDQICDLYLENQKEFTVYVDGIKYTDGIKETFVNGEKIPKYESLYELYYGNNSFERIYDFGNNTGLNLLIVSDSFSNPINAWLSSHFDKTIVLDPRASKGRSDAYLNKYIREYDIDAVVYLMCYDSLFMNGYFHIPTE